MYGTIARMKVKPGMIEKLHEIGDRATQELGPSGFLWEHIFQSDSDPNEVWLVVAFTNREAYHKNANDPRQAQQYGTMRAMLDADPEWHDGEIIDSHAV